MQSVSETWNEILADDNHWFETRLLINGVYYTEEKIFSISTNYSVFEDSLETGNAIAGEITVQMLRPEETIPKMAEIRPQIRVRNAESYSEWIPQGVFFIDTREYSKNENGLDIMTIHGFDAMLKAEKLYAGRITGNSTDTQMVAEIAYQMGVSVDSRTNTLMNKSYTVPLPTSYTYREVLGYIASMYVGNFIISDEGKLRLVTMLELPAETNYLIDHIGNAITFGVTRGESQRTLSGSVVSFNNVTDETISSLEVGVNPVQDLHGFSKPWAAGSGKNLLYNNLSTITTRGVTFTVNSDGTVTANGKATGGNAQVTIYFDTSVLYGDLYFIGLYSNGGSSTWDSYVWDTTAGARVKKWDGETASESSTDGMLKEIKIIQNHTTGMTLRVYDGKTASNVVFKPMICASTETSAAWAPYENLCPITGWTAASGMRTGANVWDEQWEVGGFNITNGNPLSLANAIRSKNFIPVKPGATYYRKSSKNILPLYYGLDKTFLSYTGWGKDNTITTPSNCYFVKFYTYTDYGETYLNDISINYPSTDTAYHAYSGAPISVTFPGTAGTVYGGTLDVTNGVLTVTHKKITFTPSMGWYTNASWPSVFYMAGFDTASNYDAPTSGGIGNKCICDRYKGAYTLITAIPDQNFAVNITGVTQNNTSFAVKDTRFSTVADFKASFTSFDVIVPIKTATTYQLTPQEVATLHGQNNIWFNTGDSQVTLYTPASEATRILV